MVDFEGGIYCRAPWWIFLLKIMFFFRSTFYILAIVNRPHAIFSSKNSTGPLRGNQRNLLPRQLGCSGSADLFLSFMFGRVSLNKSFFLSDAKFCRAQRGTFNLPRERTRRPWDDGAIGPGAARSAIRTE